MPELAFAQNFTANQPDNVKNGIAKSFSVTDATYTLLASSRGLELYAHRLDPGNHCNLLHLFELDATGRPVLAQPARSAPHFKAAWLDNPTSGPALADDFLRLRKALAERVAAKRAYIVERGVAPANALDPACLHRVNREGRDTFYRPAAPPGVAPAAMPAFEISYKLR